MRGLYFAKSWFTTRLGYFVKLAVRRSLSPDLFTWLGVLGAAIAAYALVENLWPVVAAGLVLRLAGANLDGAVARARQRSNPVGFITNEIGDRTSDFIIISSLVVIAQRASSSPALYLALIATAMASLPTLISISGAASGGQRINGGPFGKTERCAAVLVLSLLLSFGANPVCSVSIVSVVVTLGSVLTAVLRFNSYRRSLGTTRSGEGK